MMAQIFLTANLSHFTPLSKPVSAAFFNVVFDNARCCHERFAEQEFVASDDEVSNSFARRIYQSAESYIALPAN